MFGDAGICICEIWAASAVDNCSDILSMASFAGLYTLQP